MFKVKIMKNILLSLGLIIVLLLSFLKIHDQGGGIVHENFTPSLEPGQNYQFIKDALPKNITQIGYYTDRILTPEKIDTGYLLSAQYALAPIILDLNNTSADYILEDLESGRIQLRKNSP
jgi:hypothetical protein